MLFHRIVYFTVTFTEFNHVVIPGIFGSAIASRWLTGYRSGRNLAHFRRRLQVLLRERNPVLHQGYLEILHCRYIAQLTRLGIAYQLTPSDPLVDTAQCKRDIARMSELGTNAIRVYHVDPHADHKGCMSALADAGMIDSTSQDNYVY